MPTTQLTGTPPQINKPVKNGTVGSVLFVGAGGVLQEANANLYWDDSNKRLGVGTTSPSYKIDVNGEGKITQIRSNRLLSTGNVDLALGTSDTIFVTIKATTGDVGIGDSTPDGKLDIQSNSASTPVLIVQGTTAQAAHLTSWQNSVGTPLAYVDSSGNLFCQSLTASGLTVSHTTTYIDSQIVTIADKTLELASLSGSPLGNDAYVDGGGIILKSSEGDKSLTWADLTDSWTSSHDFEISSGKVLRTEKVQALNSNGLYLVDDANNGIFIRDGGNIGIGTNNPTTTLDIGGYGVLASLMGNSKLVIADNLDNLTGVQMYNANSGINSDFRFAIFDNVKDNYIAFSMPGDGNNNSLFGNQRNTSAYIFTNGSSANRNLSIGTVKAKDLILGTNNTERVRINSTGNVGIGTTSPSGKLDIISTNDADTIIVRNASYQTIGRFRSTSEGDGIFAVEDRESTNKVLLRSSGDSYFNGGNVGIGTTSPTAQLHLMSPTTTSMKIESSGNSSVGRSLFQMLDSSDSGWEFSNNLALDGNKNFTISNLAGGTRTYNLSIIKSNGNVGIGTTSPNRKLHVAGESSNQFISVERTTTNTSAMLLGAREDGTAIFSRASDSSSSPVPLHFVMGGSNTVVIIASGGDVGIGTTSPTAKLDVRGNTYTSGDATITGHLAANTKSFLIDHPTVIGKKLQYACLEGPENGVYIRGIASGTTIELPYYWKDLVHEDSITVTLTPAKFAQPNLFVESVSVSGIVLSSDRNIFSYYIVNATRKDVPALEVEI